MQDRICFVLDHLGIGGVQEYILDYVKSSSSERKILVVSIFSNDFYSARLRSAGAEVVFLTKDQHSHISILNPRNLIRFSRFMADNRRNFHFVHVKLFGAFAYASLTGCWRFQNVSAGIDCKKTQIPAYIRIIFYMFARYYKRFYMHRSIWAEFGHYGILPERVRDQPVPVTRRHSDHPQAFSTTHTFLSVGRGIAQKGHAEAVEFFEILKPLLGHDVSLAIIGDGPAIDELKARPGCGPDSNVIFVGSVENYDDWLMGATGIIRMAFGEDTNSVIREGLLAGKIVASSVEGPSSLELVHQGLVVAIDRSDLAASARALAAEIAVTSEARSAQISERAEQLWPRFDISTVYD